MKEEMIVTLNGVNVVIQGPFEKAPKNLRFVAKVQNDPEYSKAYGVSRQEALGSLVFSCADFFDAKFEHWVH